MLGRVAQKTATNKLCPWAHFFAVIDLFVAEYLYGERGVLVVPSDI
jgi:hypothetical protein